MNWDLLTFNGDNQLWLYAGGLLACYLAGWGIGAAVRLIQKIAKVV